jgi:hypothetical protein
MKLSGVLVAVCVATCGLFTVLVAPDTVAAAFMGMAAPLMVGIATIVMVERTIRTALSALTTRMTIAFLAKMVFYAAYVSVVIAFVTSHPLPFIISFTVYFVALQIIEAVYFKTLFTQAGAAVTVN